ncbi:hypothetical protein [Vibrio sp. HN007]|uniref:hypothetical protein n=1 Tax=Vibrio iocasae TaxID=3098914 RepID=UPI0035D3FF29
MDAKDWIPIFISQSNIVMIYWNIYIVVAVGIIGYVAQRAEKLTTDQRKLFVLAWFLFVISNLPKLYEAQSSLYDIHKQLDLYACMFSASHPYVTTATHLLFDILITYFIYKWKAGQ